MLATGEILDGRYRLGRLIGRGGMADVYRADDLVSDDTVAVKLLRRLPSTGRWSGREIEALIRLDHPGLVRLRSWGTTDGGPYLVLDLVDGQTLADVLAHGPLSPGRAAEVTTVVADALAHAHTRGVCHRDVKPANILVDESGRPHLADFGVARLADATATTGAGFVIGTAAYLAPEQVRGERVGPPADVYALGLVLLECLTAKRAFPGTFNEAAAAHLTQDPVVPASVPFWLGTIVRRVTARDPASRPTAAGLARALRAGPLDDETAIAVAGAGAADAAGRTAVLTTPPVRRSSRRPLAVAAVLGGSVGLVVALAATQLAGSSPPATTTVPPVVTTAPPSSPPSSPPPTPTTVAVTTIPTTVATTVATTTTAPTTTTTVKGKGKNKGGDNGD